MFRSPRSILAFMLCSAAVLVSAATAQAQVVPFRIVGARVVDFIPLPGESAPHWAVGTATVLGPHCGEGAVRALDFSGPTTAEFDSVIPFVFTARDGDRLAFHYGRPDLGADCPGEVELFPLADGRFVSVLDCAALGFMDGRGVPEADILRPIFLERERDLAALLIEPEG